MADDPRPDERPEDDESRPGRDEPTPGTDELRSSTDQADSSEDGGSSLEDLAESVRRRSGGGGGEPDVSLNLGRDSGSSDDRDRDSRFDWLTTGRESGPGPVPPAVRDATNILLLGPLSGEHCDRNCARLSALGDPSATNALYITATQSADERMDQWEAYPDAMPANTVIISLGDDSRAARGSSTTELFVNDGQNRIEIKRISDPSDLVRLGIVATEILSEWETTERRNTVVCVHSLTSLLQYVDPQRLFRFLHVFTNKLRNLDAIDHYHMDPTAHDDQTVSLFTSMFDTIVEITDDGELDVVSTQG